MKLPLKMMMSANTVMVAGLFAAGAALAQPVPEAGQILEQLKQPVQPQPAPTELLIRPGTAEQPTAAGGVQVVVKTITLQGMTRFDEATLLAALGEYRDRTFDLAGLRGLAGRITRFYRERGYPVALAYLPPQTVKGGALEIRIVEGRYGEVRVEGDPSLAAGARAFLGGLEPGEVIEGAPLERAIHLLGDQPGVVISPVLMPGSAVGSGDLEVRIAEGERFAGDIGLDNYGNRYTGDLRSSVTLGVNRLLAFGDQLTLGALYTDEHLWYGRLGYSLPLGGSGLRARAEYLRTAYELGEEFSSLGATGNVDISTLGLAYPLIRSQRANLSLQADYVHKALEERANDAVPTTEKSSDALPLSLRFDRRDALAGGGLTWGELTWTPGRLDLDSGLRKVDRLTARTDGRFNRLNLELARLQRLPGSLSLYGRFSGQWSAGNLDSSEGFGLGGANGVRAYPQGEALGDRGWLGQVELRWSRGAFAPYAFFDGGGITVNADTWEAGENHRRLSGGGLGVRYATAGISFDVAAAWRVSGGEPESDTRNDQPRFWGSAHYRF